MTNSFGSMSIAELSALIQMGKVDPVEVTEEVLAGIAAYPDKAVFTSLLEDRATTEAHAASKRLRQGRSLGLLDGIPIAWKDLFDIEGLPTTAGSKVLKKAAPAAKDAAIVDLLKQAGMVAVGRTNMSEFAFSGIGINPHYGTPHNPHGKDVPRIPGGSSSGSGVAVAAGLVPVAMGTDTGGSIRIPAGFNGIVGYKATRGRYRMDGVYPLATSLDRSARFAARCRTQPGSMPPCAGFQPRRSPASRHGRSISSSRPTSSSTAQNRAWWPPSKPRSSGLPGQAQRSPASSSRASTNFLNS